MHMSEGERGELNPEWAEAMKTGLTEALDNFELYDQLINVSPITISNGSDERLFQELSNAEREFVVKLLHRQLGLDPFEEKRPVRSYHVEAPKSPDVEKYPEGWQGEASVNVFETARSDEDMFLHEVQFPDGKLEYAIAPADRQI